jgi:uncharacterized protein (DUF1501 family)
MLSRRSFLRASSLLAVAPTVPVFIARSAAAVAPNRDRRVLVVVQLDGGNDALNTVVPHADPIYQKLRPRLRLQAKDLIRLSETLGLHSALKSLGKLLEAGQLAVIPGVGYPNPSRSHFRSMSIWHTARLGPNEHSGPGWLGRALGPSAGPTYVVGGGNPKALRGDRSTVIGMSSIAGMLLTNPEDAQKAVGPEPADDLLAFVRRQAVDAHSASARLRQVSSKDSAARYPRTGLGDNLKRIARLLKADLWARVYYTIQGGYDTHGGQHIRHPGLLSDLAGSIAAFFADLTSAGLAERVVVLAFSEFGRTIKENGGDGTDHGTAGCVFLAGPGVKGGLFGSMPSLTDLCEGEPKMTTDFRQVYATALQAWLGLPSRAALGGVFEPLALFRAS